MSPDDELAIRPAGRTPAGATPLRRAAALAEEHLAGIADRRVAASLSYEDAVAALDEPLPEQGEDLVAVVERLAAVAGPRAASPGPRYFGFVTGGALPAALAADWLVARGTRTRSAASSRPPRRRSRPRWSAGCSSCSACRAKPPSASPPARRWRTSRASPRPGMRCWRTRAGMSRRRARRRARAARLRRRARPRVAADRAALRRLRHRPGDPRPRRRPGAMRAEALDEALDDGPPRSSARRPASVDVPARSTRSAAIADASRGARRLAARGRRVRPVGRRLPGRCATSPPASSAPTRGPSTPTSGSTSRTTARWPSSPTRPPIGPRWQRGPYLPARGGPRAASSRRPRPRAARGSSRSTPRCDRSAATVWPTWSSATARWPPGGGRARRSSTAREVLNEVVLNQVLVRFGDDDEADDCARCRGGPATEGRRGLGGDGMGRAARRRAGLVSSWATTEDDVDRLVAAFGPPLAVLVTRGL